MNFIDHQWSAFGSNLSQLVWAAKVAHCYGSDYEHKCTIVTDGYVFLRVQRVLVVHNAVNEKISQSPGHDCILLGISQSIRNRTTKTWTYVHGC